MENVAHVMGMSVIAVAIALLLIFANPFVAALGAK
jgi:hypothetical protein